MALVTVVGLENGFGSAIFAVAAIFAIIVMTDATHVRRSVGEQGEVLRKLIERDHKQEGAISSIARETGAGDDKTRAKLHKPYLARGHRFIEVVVGGVIGATVGLAVVCLTL
jgi:acid phosphatase family membrane protein YuiD